MTNRQCIANLKFTLKTSATDEQLISLADSISLSRYGTGLDSLDTGDSMGLFMRIAHDDMQNGEICLVYPGIDFLVEMDIEHDRFTWE